MPRTQPNRSGICEETPTCTMVGPIVLVGNWSGPTPNIALSRAMRELPEGYRKIFLMHEVKGYDHREIANLLSCSVGNSKSQLHRAKAKMRELMGSKRKGEAIPAVSEMAPEMPMQQSWEPSQAVA